MKHWTELRTAYYVAKYQSISAAARSLDIHRATVLRHLDVLESELGCKLFLREQRGYELTEAGEDMLRVVRITEEQINQFERRSKGVDERMQGELIITGMDLVAPILMPAIEIFQRQFPKIRLRYFSSEELIKLEFGQAHIAFRAGAKPNDDNYVVLPFFELNVGIYASGLYINNYGLPKSVEDFKDHRFIGTDDVGARVEMGAWMREQLTHEQIVLRTNSYNVQMDAIENGVGIGLLLEHEAKKLNTAQTLPERKVQRVLPEVNWPVSNWIVTHGDIHRTEKVQAFLQVIKCTSSNLI